VHLQLHRVDDDLILVIADNGLGFEPDAVTTDARPRLGLRLLHDLATDACGELRLASTPGFGTRIHLTVPATQP